MNLTLNDNNNAVIPTPKISIGIVVYNGERYIKSALDSIVRQSYRNIELIVVDGGSTDATQAIIESYKGYIAKYISEPDDGIYHAMNKVCRIATGEWLIFIGCDDSLLDSLEQTVSLMTNPDAVYYGDVIASSYGKIYGGKFNKFRLLRNNICHAAIFYPAIVYKKYSYDMKYKLLADYVYNLKLMADKIKFIHTGIVVSIFNNKGASTNGDVVFNGDRIELTRKLFGLSWAMIVFLCLLRDKYIKLISA